MTDGNTYAINKHLNYQEDYDFKDEYEEIAADNVRLEARVEQLEAKLAKAAEKAYEKCYKKGQYDLAQSCKAAILNIASTTIEELKGETNDN